MIYKNHSSTSNRFNSKPLEVKLIRGSSIESKHKVHATVCDIKGRVLMYAGNPNYETYVRSCLKPFQALPLISSGAAASTNCGDKGIAIACGSHAGTAEHAREAFKILWYSDIDVKNLKCFPLDPISSPLIHNCSGKHASFLATCKKMNWPLEDYLMEEHPLQVEIFRRIADLLSIHRKELIIARDECGAPTIFLSISQIALLYAHLSSSSQAEFEQITRAMIANPTLIGGEGKFDTELMKRAHGQLISKGGSEGVQAIGKIGEGLGVVIKVEDGSKRAKHSVAIHLLKQLDWLTPTGIEELEEKVLSNNSSAHLEVSGDLRFDEN